jgi:hypothetical protein
MTTVYDQDQGPAPAGGLMADLLAKFDLHIGATDRLVEHLRRKRPPAQPVFGRTAATGLFVTATPLILRFPLPGPDQGHFWYVRSIVIGGLSPTVTAAGRADIFVSASNLLSQPSLAAIGLADWRDQAATLPDVSFYGEGELPLRLNEELFVVITGGTNGQQYVAAAQFVDYEESAAQEGWSL